MSGTVLIVDDERTLARAVKAFLLESGYEAEVASDAEQALGLLESLRPDVVFSDVRLPGMTGIELLRRIREFDPSIPVIIMTAYGTIEGAVEAVKLGAYDYLKKPLDLEELKILADRAHEHSQLRQELSYYRRRAARLLVEVVCEDDDHLLDLISKRIRAVPSVRSTETFVYLKLRKQLYNWGTR
jgi:DNA-binding NtrC family response regulator